MKMRGWMLGVAMVMGLGLTAAAQRTVLPQGRYNLAMMPAAIGQVAVGQSYPEAGVKDDLFAGTKVFEKGATDVTEITMDPGTLELVGGKNEHKARNMVLNVVRTYTYDKPGMYNMADVDAIRSRLNTGEWHCSVHVRELKTGESTDVCSKHRTDGLKETAIITVEPKELTFIHTIRRAGGPGSSELGGMPLLPSVRPLPMMAMLTPGLEASLGELGVNSALIHVQMAARLAAMSGVFAENKARMAEQMAEAQKQIADSMKKLKGLPSNPAIQKQMHDMEKQMEQMKIPDAGTKQPE